MRVPWIRVHGSIISKPVVMRLAEATHISTHEAVGVLVTFWGAVASHATDGAVAGYSDAQIEAWAMWRRKRGAFAKWVRTAHLDADGRVNEWDDYAGKLESRREAERERMANVRKKTRERTANSAQNVREVLVPARANGTERYGTVEQDPSATTARAAISAECDWWPDESTRASIAVVFAEIPEGKQPSWQATLTGYLNGLGYPNGKAADPRDVAEGLLAARAQLADISDMRPSFVAGCARRAEENRTTPNDAKRPVRRSPVSFHDVA